MEQSAIEDKQGPAPLAQAVGHIARVLDAEVFSTGERARLKRWSPGNRPSLAFYRFAFRHLPDDWERRQEAWLTLVTGIALMYPNPHRSDLPLGRALAEAGYAESRLERLLAAEGDVLQTLLLRAARFLRAKNSGCKWTDAAYLLSVRGDSQEARLHIARAYYREMQRQESKSRQGEG